MGMQIKKVKKKINSCCKSRTLWFSLLLAIFGAIYEDFDYLKRALPPDYYGYSFVIIGIIVAILRFLTTQAITNK
jgi:hypothetical protein